ncbi:MAG: peptidylprolyl isomerase [Verrucomicrobiaceae bacterium]|nr:peptidylprolyl isomerase [Verrucomicrobiaceae bacterium]
MLVLLCVFAAPASSQAQTAPSACVAANTIIDASSVEVRVRWQDNSSDEDGFQIGYTIGSAGGAVQVLTTVSAAANATEVSFTVASNALGSGTLIYWYVRAFKGTANAPTSTSAWSNDSGFAWPNAAAPVFNAPTSLNATSPSEGIVSISFTDNATNEFGYEIHVRSAGGSTYTYLFDLDYNDTTAAFIRPQSPIDIMVRGFRVVSGSRTYTGQVEKLNFGFAAFNAPSNLTFTALVPEQVVLNWQDNSAIESNYQVEYRFVGDATYTSLGYFAANTTTYTLNGVPPEAIQFRVRATRGSGPDFFSGYSNEVTATTSLAPPTSLTGSSPAEGMFNLSWTDNSVFEANYEVQYRLKNAATFLTYDFYAANTTSKTNLPIEPGNIYEFRVRATIGAQAETSSLPSNIVEVSVPFNAPTNLVATPASDRQINFTWTDNSTVEDGYALYCKLPTESASQFRLCGFVAANVTSISVSAMDTGFQTPFTPNTAYDFELAAYAGDTLSNSLAVTATTKDGVTNDLSPPLFVNAAFSHTFALTTGQGTISSTSITGTLPPGVTYNASTRTLTGPATARGSYTPTLNVSWSNGWTTTYKVHLRPIYAKGRPIVATPIAAHTLTLGGAGGSVVIPLAATFADPDSESAITMTVPGADGTPGGRSLTIILNDSVTPDTVNNFRYYLNASDGYVNSVFHRLSSGFVLQGGSYKSGASANAFTSIPKGGSFSIGVPNEPGLANIKGTLAMAKLGGNPNSATTDFFFNLNDNTANLDAQNEGFSVFGRVADPSIATMDALGVLPLPPASGNPQAPNYAVTVNGQNTFFTELPHNAVTSPASINSSQLLRINGVTQNVPVLGSHSASSSNTSIVTTSMTGTDLTITGVAPGTATISLQVTDLDGNQLLTPHTFTVTVSSTYSTWAAAEGLTAGQNGTADDPDADGRKNLLEYALMSGPLASNGSAEPILGTSSDAGANKATLTFKVRKFAALTYTVEGSTDLLTWGTVWTSADGFTDDNVTAAVDNADHTLLTVRDSAAYSSTQHRFLRLKVTSP